MSVTNRDADDGDQPGHEPDRLLETEAGREHLKNVSPMKRRR